jgi:uncharacterized protein (TIGR02145 family)
MNKHLLCLLTGFVLLATSCCKPDEPDLPYNPLNGLTTAVFNPNKSYGSVADIDGNVYKTIQIGDQVWMAENLRTTRYRNGDSVPNVLDNNEWANLIAGAYCNYGNTQNLDTIATYGRLYNWHAAADERNLAPQGWRVPTIADWDKLIEYLGGDTIAGGNLKEAGDLHWESPNRADNSSGFTALPGGWRHKLEVSEEIEYFGSYWALPSYNDDTAPLLYLFSWDTIFYRRINFKVNGYSIRCIKE